MKVRSFEYDIAFSFAEENRDFVGRVVELLQSRSVKVYYDDHERINNWGEDLRTHIHNVYLNRARFCMMFISEQYKQKYWTQFEHERMKARSFFAKNKKPYILPFRLDDTEINGITDTLIYLTAEKLNEEQLAEAIYKKVNGHKLRIVFMQKAKTFLSKKTVFALSVLGIVGLSLFGISGSDFSEQPRSISESEQSSSVPNTMKISPASNSSKLMSTIKEWRFKAVCKDGWLSQSHGPGTCSGHGGIDHYVDTAVYGSSIDQCRYQSMNAFKSKNR
jgi:hypothetical protein